MPTQNILFNQNRGGFLFDTSTSSNAQRPAGYCTDLVGCGNDTHIAGQYSATLNSRVNCESPTPALQISYSGYVARAIQDSLAGINETILGVAINAQLGNLVAFLVNAMNTTPTVASYATVLGVASSLLKDRGAQYILQGGNTKKRLIANIQRVQTYDQLDQCDIALGKVSSSSVSVLGFDLDTCQPSLLWQASLSIFASYELYGDPVGVGTLLVGPIITDVAKTKLYDITGVATSTSTCDTIGTTMEIPWLTLLDTGFVIGAP